MGIRSLRLSKLRKIADLTSDLATNWDFPIATKQTVMSDDRDFSRPREDFAISNVPSGILTGQDNLQADDTSGSITLAPVNIEGQRPKPDDTIKQFQQFFGLEQTGIIDDKLISAAKTIEDKIAKSVNNPGANGLLWDDSSKTFKTTLSDLQEALKKIQQFEQNKK